MRRLLWQSICYILVETAKVEWQLMGKTDLDLVSLPIMTDRRKLMCMQILNVLFLHAFLARPDLVLFVTLKALRLTMKYGLSLIAPIAFTLYGMAQLQLGRVHLTSRFGSLAMQLLDKLGQDEALPRVYIVYYGCIHPLTRPFSQALDKFLEAYSIGLQTGDYEFACINANVYRKISFDSALSLETLGNHCLHMVSVMETLGQETMIREVRQTVLPKRRI